MMKFNYNAERRYHSYFRLGKGNLHFSSGEDFVMQVGDCLEAVLDGVKLYKGHVFLVRVAEDLHGLDFSVLTKDLVKRMFAADLLFQRTHM